MKKLISGIESFVWFLARRGKDTLLAILLAQVSIALLGTLIIRSELTENIEFSLVLLATELLYLAFEFVLYKKWVLALVSLKVVQVMLVTIDNVLAWIQYYAVNLYRLLLFFLMALSVVVVTTGAIILQMVGELHRFVYFVFIKKDTEGIRTPTWSMYRHVVESTIKHIMKL